MNDLLIGILIIGIFTLLTLGMIIYVYFVDGLLSKKKEAENEKLQREIEACKAEAKRTKDYCEKLLCGIFGDYKNIKVVIDPLTSEKTIVCTYDDNVKVKWTLTGAKEIDTTQMFGIFPNAKEFKDYVDKKVTVTPYVLEKMSIEPLKRDDTLTDKEQKLYDKLCKIVNVSINDQKIANNVLKAIDDLIEELLK